MIASEVTDFPEPDSPTMPSTSPAARSNETQRTAATDPLSDGKLTCRSRTDNTVPEAVTKATLKQYRHSDAITEIMEFPDRAHSLTIDSGWRTVADAALSWLDRHLPRSN